MLDYGSEVSKRGIMSIHNKDTISDDNDDFSHGRDYDNCRKKYNSDKGIHNYTYGKSDKSNKYNDSDDNDMNHTLCLRDVWIAGIYW